MPTHSIEAVATLLAELEWSGHVENVADPDQPGAWRFPRDRWYYPREYDRLLAELEMGRPTTFPHTDGADLPPN